jgi:tetratricopeptide (TPR) repeat protein
MVKVSGKEQDFVTLHIRYGVVYQTQKKYNEALKYYLKGLQLSLKYKLPQWTCNYYSTIAETYESLGDYKKLMNIINFTLSFMNLS